MFWKAWFLTLATTLDVVAVGVSMSATGLVGYLFASFLLLISTVCLHIWSLEPANSLSLPAIQQKYLEQMRVRIFGGLLLLKFRRACRDVVGTQSKTLMKILQNGKSTTFGRDHHLANIRTVKDFRLRMRLTTYEDYRAYVDRCVEGEENVLFRENIDIFGATSGTTSGKSKLYPISSKVIARQWGAIMAVGLSTTISEIPGLKLLKPGLGIWTYPKLSTTARGVPKGSLSQLFMRTIRYLCYPREALTIKESSGYYVQMLFGLRERELGTIMTTTSSVLLVAFTLVENEWEKMVRDIRRGELGAELEIPDDIRCLLNSELPPDPKRADELTAIFKSGFRRMATRVWPHLAGISCFCKGTFALQTRVIQDKYVGHTVPFYINFHGSTEGLYGVAVYDGGLRWGDSQGAHGGENVSANGDLKTQSVDKRSTNEPRDWDEGSLWGERGEVRDDYVLLTDHNFYEFIAIEDVDEDQPITSLAHQVRIGHIYEIVFTGPRGFYRYRTGDVIRIVGFYGNTPTYQMLQRVGDVLNVHLEKVPEVVMREAMQKAQTSWTSGRLINFAACENIHVEKVTGESSGQLFYVVFVETDTGHPLLEEEKLLIDKTLYDISDTYRAYRSKGTISAPRVLHVKTGSFELLRSLASDRNPLMYRYQYKHPRTVRDQNRLALLLQQVID